MHLIFEGQGQALLEACFLRIEAATDFAIPHGIGVTIGMDMANYVSGEIGFGDKELHGERHDILKRNFRDFERYPVPVDAFLNAIDQLNNRL